MHLILQNYYYSINTAFFIHIFQAVFNLFIPPFSMFPTLTVFGNSYRLGIVLYLKTGTKLLREKTLFVLVVCFARLLVLMTVVV